MAVAESKFNSIWIVESLRENDSKTGRKLHEFLHDYSLANELDLNLNFVTPNSSDDFLGVLTQIKEAVTNDDSLIPLLHIECHGSIDGLWTSSGECVTWEELRSYLVDINFACRNNLIVNVAACNGIYLIHTATKLERAPFWAVIGPDSIVYGVSIEGGFQDFYRTFFETGNANNAIDALNATVDEADFQFVSAIRIFTNAYRKYDADHCHGEGLEKRMAYLVEKSMENPDIKAKGREWAYEMAEKYFREEQDSGFEKIVARFFFLNEFPETRERVTLSREQILQ